MCVESLAYMKVAKIDKVPKRSFGFDQLIEFKNPKKVKSSSSDDDDSVNVGPSTISGRDKYISV